MKREENYSDHNNIDFILTTKKPGNKQPTTQQIDPNAKMKGWRVRKEELDEVAKPIQERNKRTRGKN